jgi:hypothetical protein
MKTLYFASAALLVATTAPALAADKKPVELPVINKCATSFGTLAITDGDSQGWVDLGLGSPRELLETVVTESGCFTMFRSESGGSATFLMNATAGSNEQVNGVANNNNAKAAARAAGIGGMGGRALGMLGGLGGKKKTVSVGLRVLSPVSGMTVAQGTAESVKSSITLGGAGGFGLANKVAGVASNYMNSKEGAQLATAFINAYNAVTAQSGALTSAPKPAAVAAGPVVPTTAVATSMLATPSKTGAVVRALRAGTALTPTGKKDGLFIEVMDSFGTAGWVSVEDMR